MSSSFNGWSAYDIVGSLTKKEVRALLLDYDIERSCFRTWDAIEEMILASSDEVKNVVYQSALAKKKVEDLHRNEILKRKREEKKMARNVRRRLVSGEHERDFSNFMVLPNAEEERLCYESFYERTSNEALILKTCPVCAREKLAKDGEDTMLLSEESVLEVFTSTSSNNRTRGEVMVLQHLLERNEAGVGCWMCFECIRPLERRTLPKLSLANNLWIGETPSVLTGLTIPEQLLIARHYPRCYIFKLYPRDVDSHIPLDQLYTGMAGNASLFELNTQEVVEMIKGQRMPSSVQSLASIIAITYVGSKFLPKDWLKKTFRVRREVVYEALVWLQSHNPIYADIKIDENRMRELPEDDVPDELLTIIRQEKDDELVEREKESYLLADDERVDEDVFEESTEMLGRDEEGAAHVIPIQFVGVQDCEEAKMTTNEVLLYALANADDDRYGHEGGYAVIHSAQPVPDLPGASESFDALAGAYPALWPYGRGLYHENRRRKIGFHDYIRWTLQYYDKRFRRHHSFPFVAFSIQQKQSALLSAKIHMRREDFEADTDLLADLSLRDLQEAQVDEEAHRSIGNERVRRLQHHLYATSSHVMGSAKMRTTYRSQIWGTCLWLRPPSLWVTINPMDYEDPIAQVLAGEEIDMDSYIDMMASDANKRARNMANDPFASASFFNFIIRTTFETLFGVHTSRSRVESHMGIFGLVNGYFGVVEAQGRGSLHIHLLVWLKNAPNADEMMELLTQPNFREKIASYIDRNIRTHLDGFDEEYVESNQRERHISFSRPPDPRNDNWEAERKEMEWKLARAYQVHVCKTSTCLRRNREGILVCKRRAPWPIMERTVVHASGVLDLRRTYGFLNGYSPAILVCLRCNNDIKVVIYGKDTKNLGWYLTNYQSKDPSKTYNMSALLGSALAYHQTHSAHLDSLREKNRLLVYRCFNVLNRQAELSGPQVMSYLMSWGDCFSSHQYVSVYWGQVANALKRVYPSLDVERRLEAIRDDNTDSNEERTTDVEKHENEVLTLIGNTAGKLHVQRQVEDYALRGPEFEDMGFLSFTVETYERRIGMQNVHVDDTEDNEESRHMSISEGCGYLQNHPKKGTHTRVYRSETHNFLPNIVGSWLPRRDGEENTRPYYHASMLALLKPWRELEELKEDSETWESAFNIFMETATRRDRDVVAGCQYYYDSRNSARTDRTEDEDVDIDVDRDSHIYVEDEEETDIGEEDPNESTVASTLITDEDVVRYENMQRRDKEYIHGQLAVEAARIQGIFPDIDTIWKIEQRDEETVQVAKRDVDITIDNWRTQLEQSSLFDSDTNLESNAATEHMEARVTPISQMWLPPNHDDVVDEMQSEPIFDINNLNDDQRRAYDIVDWHLKETVDGKQPPQLLMVIPGEGGVGKSKVIQIITENFRRHGLKEWWVKGAYTGIAASLIDGKTLHVLAGIPVRGGKQSAQTLKKLHAFWRTKRYLIIDEVSMLSRTFFAKLSQIISRAMETKEDEVFGGLNVILVGDFHQFPPVVARRSAPLYWPVNSRQDTEEDILGRKIFEQFITVVKLNKQIRVQDAIWHNVLQHIRYGNCRREHIETIRRLIITNPDCPHTDFNSSPWKDAKLVTPRHAVRNQWNSAAIKKHCKQTRRRLYICPAEDTIGGRIVTNDEKIAIMTRSKGSQSHFERGGLMKDIELAIGAEVMVTLNILTDMDVANGVRGVIEGIVLDERERVMTVTETNSIQLRYPPRYVLVKLNRTKAPSLENLPQNVIPIVPVKKTFTITKNGTKMTVTRYQLPLTLAYAFTDYRSQGQTLEPVIVDIGPPPYGRLTPFNVYVALSRGTGRDNIRLLRDFDETLLQHHPSKYLRLEDERLDSLNDSTKEIWESRRHDVY